MNLPRARLERIIGTDKVRLTIDHLTFILTQEELFALVGTVLDVLNSLKEQCPTPDQK
mgnify:CR=1 FL=1